MKALDLPTLIAHQRNTLSQRRRVRARMDAKPHPAAKAALDNKLRLDEAILARLLAAASQGQEGEPSDRPR